MMCDKSMLGLASWYVCVHVWHREVPYHISLLQLAAHECCISKDVSQKEKVDEEYIPFKVKVIQVEKDLDRDMQQTQAEMREER